MTGVTPKKSQVNEHRGPGDLNLFFVLRALWRLQETSLPNQVVAWLTNRTARGPMNQEHWKFGWFGSVFLMFAEPE